MVGETVRHYRIEEKIGEGGMGVVYRAEDTKLKRTVALKFLPPESTRSAEARERFIHEAQAASALDHPNICTIYEIDETDEGQVYIAMGLYKGQTLREKIAERPLKLGDAIDITTQIAQGLAKAHEQKIVHRDIKPANIFITTEGQVKILDFGVAKLAGSTKLTLTGTTLGTVSYMAPEQARGDEADHKADIWSLGVLIYEMLTGQQPFRGEHEQAIIYSILNEEPEPITALRTGIPIDLEWIVQKALKKDPRQRYQHIDEIPVDLEAVEDRRISASRVSAVTLPSAEIPAAQPTKRPDLRKLVGLIAILALIAGVSADRLFLRGSAESAGPLLRFNISLPEMNLTGSGSRVVVSPDGKYLVFQAVSTATEIGGTRHLFIRSIEDVDIELLPDTQDAVYPTFSPDGEWIAFIDMNGWHLKRHALESGRTVEICLVGSSTWGMDWGPDDTIIYSPRETQRLILVSAFEGTQHEVPLADSVDAEISFRWPQFLPGGKEVLITLWRDSYDNAQIAALSLKTGKLKIITEEGTSFPHYLPAIRHLAYIRDETLTAVPFDIRRLEITGREIVSSEKVQVVTGGGRFSISRDGLLVTVEGEGGMTSLERLDWVDLQGNSSPLGIEPRDHYYSLDLSPEGDRVAIAVQRTQEQEEDDIWVFGVDGSNPTKLTFEGTNHRAVWSPDGRRVAFTTNRSGNLDIYVKAADGRGQAIPLLESELLEVPISWTSNGDMLAYQVLTPEGHRDLWLLNQNGESIPFVESPNDELTPVFSPDGEWIAYSSNESGQYEVYVQPRPGSPISGKWHISEGGGTEPVWAPDGRTIYYRNANRLMAVNVRSEPVFTTESPRELFVSPYRPYNEYGAYDIHPDGDRFIMQVQIGSGARSNVLAVQNWFEELKRLEGGR